MERFEGSCDSRGEAVTDVIVELSEVIGIIDDARACLISRCYRSFVTRSLDREDSGAD